jgi:molecular chaperone GrpE
MPENTNAAAADAAFETTADTIPLSGVNQSAADGKIAGLEGDLREASEKALRATAELENFRKRAQRELADERKYAVVPLVRDLLPVVDNLERAIEATLARSASEGSSAQVAPLLEGVKLVAAQLEAVLQQHQCVRIETVGAAFDPNQHQAIAQEPSDQYPAGTVSRSAQSGYKLEGRVIRPAQVFVSTGPETV